MKNTNEGLNIYSSALTALITITSAALAAAVAILQLSKDAKEFYFYWAIGSLLLSLIMVFLAFSGLTGQAIVETPDINVPNIKYPARLSLLALVIGLVFIGLGISTNGKKPLSELKILKQLQLCRGISTGELDRLKCYESWFDSKIDSISIEQIDFSKLEGDDKKWIKAFILQRK